MLGGEALDVTLSTGRTWLALVGVGWVSGYGRLSADEDRAIGTFRLLPAWRVESGRPGDFDSEVDGGESVFCVISCLLLS